MDVHYASFSPIVHRRSEAHSRHISSCYQFIRISAPTVRRNPSQRTPKRQVPTCAHASSVLSYATPGSRSLPLWQQLLSTAASTSASCPEALYSQYATHYGASILAPETTEVKAPTTLGLVRSRVVKNKRGYWRIRHFQPSDLQAVAELQASAFHEALPVGVIDQLAYTMFKAEVLDALKKKVDVLNEHGFAMMVVDNCQLAAPGCNSSGAEPCPSDSDDSESDCTTDADWESAVWYGDQQATAWNPASIDSNSSIASMQFSPNASNCSSIVGVVEIGVQDEVEVRQCLPNCAGTYAYITSMAVSPRLRRCGVGRALLQAAEQQAANWGQDLVALHVYETNPVAIKLYEKHGMRCIGKDPAWKGMLGGKVRQLMVKKVLESAQLS